MAIPTNALATKLRIIATRKKREMEEAENIHFQKRQAYEQAWLAYVGHCKDLGYCAICENRLQDCKCSFVA